MANIMGNNFQEGPLGVVKLTYDGVDMGKTLGDTTIEFIEDITDIFYAQDGTQPADKVPTGQAYQVTCQIAEINLARLEKINRGTVKAGNSMKYGRNLYISLRDNAKVLRVARVDSDGVASTDTHYIQTWYSASPTVSNGAVAFGPDSQRYIEVTFYIFYNDTYEAFGYQGVASSVGLIPAA
jgi:hypothetical protein